MSKSGRVKWGIPEGIPDHLKSTYDMVHGAFPHGLKYDTPEYFPLLCIFRQNDFSFRAIATAMVVCFDLDYIQVLHDAYSTDTEAANPLEINRVIELLKPHGFAAWQTEED